MVTNDDTTGYVAETVDVIVHPRSKAVTRFKANAITILTNDNQDAIH